MIGLFSTFLQFSSSIRKVYLPYSKSEVSALVHITIVQTKGNQQTKSKKMSVYKEECTFFVSILCLIPTATIQKPFYYFRNKVRVIYVPFFLNS